jgi:outer membrane receptor protein involved in Fe transport
MRSMPMRTAPRRWLFALALALASHSAWLPRATASDDADEAELHFQIGRDAYQRGDFRAALEHFLASNRLAPNPKVLFNVARCYEHLDRYPDAFRAFVQARDGADATLTKQIDEAIARIAPRVAILDVRTNPAGATLYLDRKELGARGTTPRLLGLATGKYKVIAELPGYATAVSAELSVKEGTRTTVTLDLEPLVATVRIKTDDDPSTAGAEVRVDRDDGEVACAAPCAITVPPGKHALHLRKPGYKALEIPLDLGPREQRDLRPQMQVLTGGVVVDADVKDALIEIDGKPFGFTPAVLQVPVGAHVVRVSRTGYRTAERKIVVTATTDQKLEVRLIEAQEVTAASRATETVDEAKASVSIVPGIELRAMGYPTIAEALRGVRGVNVTDDRSYMNLGVRGFSRLGDYGNRVLVTIDGHPANDDYVGSSFVGFDGRVDLDDVERIEIVRGPGSALYGTSAFMGVVNLVTRGRDFPTHVEAGLSTAEYGVQRARVHGTYRAAPDAGVWTSVSAAWSPDGRDFTFPEFASTNGGRAVALDGFTAMTVSGRAWWKELNFQWFYTDRDKTVPTATSNTIFGSDRTHYRDRRAFGELRWDQKLAEAAVLTHRASLDLYLFDGGFAYTPAQGGDEHDRFRGTWLGFEERLALKLGEHVHVTVGGEIQRHIRAAQHDATDDGTVFNDRDDPFWIGAGYAIVDFNVSKALTISPAARLDAYASFPVSANPRLSIIARPWSGGIVKLFGGRAFRAPSIYEQFYAADTQTAASDLTPENIWSGELEISQRLSPAVTAIVAGFVNQVQHAILLEGKGTSDDPNAYVNADSRIRTVGGELEIRRDLRDGWMASAQVSLQRTRYLDRPERYREVPNAPWILAGARGLVPLLSRSLQLSSRMTLVGPTWDRNELVVDPPQEKTRAALVWDLVFTGETERAGLRWALGLYNLFDTRWSAPISGENTQRFVLQNGRTLFASLAVSI